MQTEVLQITPDSLQKAKALFERGEIVAIPTETVYGLGAIGTNPDAVKKIFTAKGRPSDNPLIAHVHKDYDLSKLVYIENDYAQKLIKAFMPGPLTLVFNSKGVVCKEAVAGGETLAVRMPSHKDCQELLRLVDAPIVAPSANVSKHTSPVTAEHVYNDLNGKIPLILDGGKCTGGIESTVLDVTDKVPRILRAGLVTKEMIISVVGCCEIASHLSTDKVKSPGVKYTHYKPKCETRLFDEEDLDVLMEEYRRIEVQGKSAYVLCSSQIAKKLDGFKILDLGETAEEIASNLYDKLLYGEKVADVILAVKMPNEEGVYLGVSNRLNKSCG